MVNFEERRVKDRMQARQKMIESAKKVIELGREKESRINNLLMIDEGSRFSAFCSTFKVKRESHLEDGDCGDGTEDI